MPLTKIQSLGITDGTIVNADINASAAIAGTKLTGVGKVLQVVQTKKSDSFTTTSTSYVDVTGLSVSITPSSASNKVLILVNPVVYTSRGGSNTYSDAYVNLVRNSTDINVVRGAINGGTTSYVDSFVNPNINFLDSPSTTSSTTYKIQVKLSDSSNNLVVNQGLLDSTIIAIEIAG